MPRAKPTIFDHIDFPAYEYREYPKMVGPLDHPNRVTVHNADEEKAALASFGGQAVPATPAANTGPGAMPKAQEAKVSASPLTPAGLPK